MEQNEVQGIKISQLDELTSIQDDDVLASVDTSEIKTTKVKASTLKYYINKEVNNDITTIKNDYALKTSIPTKTSQLTNDSGFINKSVDNLDNYYKKDEVDLIKKDVETNKTDIKNLSNRTKRIETDIFDSGEASGTGINLQDSTLAEFQEVKIDGVGNQVTTNGNQLVDMANPTSKEAKVTSTFENDILTIVGSTGGSYQNIGWNINSSFLEKNKGKTIKYKHKSVNVSNKACLSPVQVAVYYNDDTPIFYKQIYNLITNLPTAIDYYTIPEDVSNIDHIFISIYTNNSNKTNVENTITIEEPLLYFDDNDTYEEYTGAEPSPSPDYEQPIEVIEDDFELISCGANLVDWSNVKPGSFNAIGKYENDILTVTSENPQTYPAIAYDITNILKRYENKKLKFICEDSHVSNEDATANVQLTVVTNNNKTQYISLYNIKTKNNTPFTIFKNIKSAIVGVYANNSSTAVANTSTIVKPMLFIYNNEDVNIEPYTETRQTITMPEEEFAGKIDDTYKDQFRINYNEEDGKYHLYLDKVVGKVIYNGSEFWNRLTNESSGELRARFYTAATNVKPSGIGSSNYFTFQPSNDFFVYNTFKIAQSVAISFCIKGITTTDEWKQWLQTHNTIVYYILAKPYTLDLGAIDMPLSYYPITNVYNTCEVIPNMYVKYYRDFKKTITTMQVDIENLKEAVNTLTSSQTNMANNISTLQNVVSSSLEETESEVTNDDNLQGQ